MLTSTLNQTGVIQQLSHMEKTNWGKYVNIYSFRQRTASSKTNDKMAVLRSAED